MAPQSRAEKKYLKRIRTIKDYIYMAHPEAPVEGFEYFESAEYKKKTGSKHSIIRKMFFSHGVGCFLKLLGMIFRYMVPMMKGRRECFTDLNCYFRELSEGQGIGNNQNMSQTYPNKDLWEELKEYCRTTWNAEIGFTKLDTQQIFKDKGVLFPYALIVLQEMQKDRIDRAPELEAGFEVQRVYNSLGHAVNDIARRLRKTYGIRCQSNHPLGGLVNTPPLAGKAGLGWQGLDGLLITPQYGKRVRIAPIFIQDKIFEYTDHSRHTWMEDFCKTCQKCRNNCPTGAIHGEKFSIFKGMYTCIDREKCFPQFIRTLGCSICIKVCPFSTGGDTYDRIKTSFLKRMES